MTKAHTARMFQPLSKECAPPALNSSETWTRCLRRMK